MTGHQLPKAASPHDSVVHGAIADTTPDAWGPDVTAREHATRHQDDRRLQALTKLAYLLAVDASSQVGALRLRDPHGKRGWRRTGERSHVRWEGGKGFCYTRRMISAACS